MVRRLPRLDTLTERKRKSHRSPQAARDEPLGLELDRAGLPGRNDIVYGT